MLPTMDRRAGVSAPKTEAGSKPASRAAGLDANACCPNQITETA